MALREELLSLKPMLGTDAPEFYDKVKSIAARYTSEEDKKEIADFIAGQLEEADRKIDHLEENTIKLQMQEVADIISLARFTSDELATLNRALKDISEKLGSLSVSY